MDHGIVVLAGCSKGDGSGSGGYGCGGAIVGSRKDVTHFGVGQDVEATRRLVEGGDVEDVAGAPLHGGSLIARVDDQVVLAELHSHNLPTE